MVVENLINLPELDTQDRLLLDAYRAVGRPLDDLPYTADFDEVLRKAGQAVDDLTRHQVFKRLLYMRKTARLPSVPFDFMPRS